MFPWKTVGMQVPNFSSHAFCVRKMELHHGRLPKKRTYKSGSDDIQYTLVFFSTFEQLKLSIKGHMNSEENCVEFTQLTTWMIHAHTEPLTSVLLEEMLPVKWLEEVKGARPGSVQLPTFQW
jgi:hypothetical protein